MPVRTQPQVLRLLSDQDMASKAARANRYHNTADDYLAGRDKPMASIRGAGILRLRSRPYFGLTSRY